VTVSSVETAPTIPCSGALVVRGREQGGGAVAAPQGQLEGLQPCLGRGAVPVGVALGSQEALDLALEVGELGLGHLVGAVEPDLALLVVGDGGLKGGELLLGLGGARQRGRDDALEAADLGLPGLDPGTASPDLPGELGQTFAAVGRGAGETRTAGPAPRHTPSRSPRGG
jgi:hypothetical protein